MTITFTPKKLLDILNTHGIKLGTLVAHHVDRNYFIPKYKTGSKKQADLDLTYRKTLQMTSVRKIAQCLKELNVCDDEMFVVACFIKDNFEMLAKGWELL